jgi:hypothetical protein
VGGELEALRALMGDDRERAGRRGRSHSARARETCAFDGRVLRVAARRAAFGTLEQRLSGGQGVDALAKRLQMAHAEVFSAPSSELLEPRIKGLRRFSCRSLCYLQTFCQWADTLLAAEAWVEAGARSSS